ncbi:MAG: phenylalanine--tRNA ligase subunit alpha [Bacteroidetes bacterium]|nr:MAG: phenylalanine--tRNA ligase subunit alpha [Bacteroidota bacterium]
MLEDIDRLIEAVKVFHAENQQELEQFRIRYLGKKGILNDLFREFRDVPTNQKKETGQRINDLKQLVTDRIEEISGTFSGNSESDRHHDLTLPGPSIRTGARHPVSIIRNQIIEIFSRQGFTISEGPEIEDDWHVFSALNFPPEHPARDMQDTFFISRNPDVLLRTHTSSVQVRVMEREKPPIRTISPGRVFRNEAISARAHCIFHQVEGLYIDENVSFADLKQILLYFVHEMFGPDVAIRLRPSYFPFTEPSAEMDVSCRLCGGKGCNVCKHTGWLEIMGCGMVDPNVLSFNCIDPEKYTGYAFGMGIERVAMLKYQVRDLRLYFENDVRFLDQFSSAH